MSATMHFGVGLDTARYGHYASFLRADCQPAAAGFGFAESAEGYRQLRTALEKLAERHAGNVHFHIRIDAAGQYAVNLEAFLRRLPWPGTLSIGEPKRNQDYKNAHFPKRKADPVDSLACARFAVVERPPGTPATPSEFLALRDLAGALQSQRKQTTRQINRLHNHMARVFPELARLAPNLSAAWVLELLKRYPTPQRIAAARSASLTSIPYLGAAQAEKLQAAARSSTGAVGGAAAEELVRQLVAAVRESRRAEERLSRLLEQAFHDLPQGGHRQLPTITGIGLRTAAALTAKIVSIDRFRSPESLVNYFGAFPEENSSGVDKQGRPVSRGAMKMSAKGNDLVRGLLWMACQSAIRHNPAIRELYARQRAAGKRGDVALGHCLRKILHLVFAVWKTDRPFDPQHRRPADDEPQADDAGRTTATERQEPAAERQEPTPQRQEPAAGRKGRGPVRKAVTAAGACLATRNVPQPTTGGNAPLSADAPAPPAPRPRVDFAELRRQLRMADVLERLGILDRLTGRGPQRRGPCPIHEPRSQGGRTFSVHLGKHVFRCLDPACAAQGNVLDLWAAIHQLPLRDAALHLARTFALDLDQEKKPIHHPTSSGVTTIDAP